MQNPPSLYSPLVCCFLGTFVLLCCPESAILESDLTNRAYSSDLEFPIRIAPKFPTLTTFQAFCFTVKPRKCEHSAQSQKITQKVSLFVPGVKRTLMPDLYLTALIKLKFNTKDAFIAISQRKYNLLALEPHQNTLFSFRLGKALGTRWPIFAPKTRLHQAHQLRQGTFSFSQQSPSK